MNKCLTPIFFLLCFAWTANAQAQATSTPTSTPDCCQGLSALDSQGGFNGPGGIAVDYLHDRLYVADTANNSIHVYTASGIPVTVLTSGPTVMIYGPSDVAVDQRGNLYVADYSGQRIEKFDNNLAFVTSIPMPGSGTPRAVWAESQGSIDTIYAVDNSAVFRFDGSGAVYSFGVSFGGGGTLDTPSGLVKSGQWLYVADTLNNRIVKFDTTLPNPPGIPVTVGLAGPTAIRTDLAGNFYVVEGGPGYIDMVSQDFGTLLNQCQLPGGPWGIAVNQAGNIFVSQLNANAVSVLQGCAAQPTPVPFFPGSDPPSGECFIYPAPVRGNQATLACRLAKSGKITLRIWNENGELSAEISGQRSIGLQTLPFDSSRLAPGVYSYRVTLDYDSGTTERLKLKKFAVIR